MRALERKRGRAVEGTGLENRRRGNPFVSSNLTASANTIVHIVLCHLQLPAQLTVAIAFDRPEWVSED